MTVETDCLIRYFQATGVDGMLRDINTPGVHAHTSYHYAKGTPSEPTRLDYFDGKVGGAVDLGFAIGEVDSPGLRAIFAAFSPVESALTELIHTSAPYFVHNGERRGIGNLDAGVAAAHHNHVHVAVAKGTYLVAPSRPLVIKKEDLVPSQVDACRAPDGGHWVLTSDGGVRAIRGAPFLGSYPALPPEARQGNRTFIAIEAKGPTSLDGYTIFGDDDSDYSFPAGT